MKRLTTIGLAGALALLAPAHAQSVTVGAGGTFGIGGGRAYHLSVGLRDVVRPLGVPLGLRVSYEPGGAGVLNLDLLATLGGGPTTTYAGAGVGYDPGAARFFPNVVLGANLPVAGALGAFGEFGWRVGVGGVTRFGLTFSF